jgi:subtilisin family serine protease
LVKPKQAARSIVATGLTSDGLARLTRRGFQAQVQTKGSLANVVRLLPPRGMSLAQAQQAVRVADAGAAADFDHFYYTDEGSRCIGSTCAAASLIGWNLPTATQCGPVPTIGLIDTGIDREHEALQGQSIEIVSGLQLGGMPSQRDHGTAIAALLVGRNGSSTPGLLPEAQLLAVDAFYRDNGTADRTDVTTLVMALEALAERNVRIVNMSLSGPPNEVLRRAIASAQAKGMVIVAAAGNNGAGAGPSYPAAYPGVIAVTAVDRNLDVYRRATQGDYIDLAAPGVEIQVAAPGGGYATKSGTSYAVPFISAAASVLRASDGTLDLARLQKALESHTLDLGKPGRDKTYGQGLLQATNLCPPQGNELPVAQSDTRLGTSVP